MMDPDETLSEMRRILDMNINPDYDRLANLFEGLDEWLSAGGFLPKDWEWRGSGCQ